MRKTTTHDTQLLEPNVTPAEALQIRAIADTLRGPRDDRRIRVTICEGGASTQFAWHLEAEPFPF